MIACKSMVRLNFLFRETSKAYAKSKPLLNFQKRNFRHCFSCELSMDARNGRRNVNDRKKGKSVAQEWRTVPTQRDCCKGDGKMAVPQDQLREVHHGTSPPLSIAECGNSNIKVTESGKIDASLDENLTTPKKHSLSMEIGSSLMRFVKGQGGDTQKKIEVETGVKIIFPPSRKEHSIILEGSSAESITQASEKIQTIIDKARNSRDLDYSHFVSLPLAVHPGLLDKLVNFQNTILGLLADDKNKDLDKNTGVNTLDVEENHSTTPNIPKESKLSSKDLGIEKSIFIKPETFHLTVLMLKLCNTEQVKLATEVLQSVSSKVMDALENRPVLIRLKGLNCMRGSKAKAFVLYAPVEEIGAKGRLLRACQVITKAFVDAGLVVGKDGEQQLKLHATLMNARHRKRKTRTRKVEGFDARGIFELYDSEEWGEYAILEAHLSQRFAFDKNGYYHCCASIPFPQNRQVD